MAKFDKDPPAAGAAQQVGAALLIRRPLSSSSSSSLAGALPHLSHRVEDVKVGVADGGESGSEDENDEGDRVGGHARPVQMADVRLRVKVGLGVAGGALEERRAAGEHGREPGEDDPALAPRRSLDRLVAERLPDGQVPIHRDPHERVDGHAPQSRLDVAGDGAEDVAQDPRAVRQGRIDGERDDEDSGEQVGGRQGDQVVVHHLAACVRKEKETSFCQDHFTRELLLLLFSA